MPQITVEDALNQAMEHHRNGRYQEAESIYKQIINQNPDHPDTLNCYGLLAAQFGRHDIAIQMISRAVTLSPQTPQFYFNLANSLYSIRQYQDALTCYFQALELNPNYPGAHFNIANSYRDLGDPKLAITNYQKALEQNPRDIGALNNYASLLQTFDRDKEAMNYFKQAYDANPNFTPTACNLANAYMKSLDFESAMRFYARTIELDPKIPEPYNGMGNAVLELSRYDEAISWFQKAIEVQPNYTTPHNNLGLAYKEVGQLRKSIDAFRQCLQLDPNLNVAHSNLLLTLLYDPAATQESIASESQKFESQFGQLSNLFTEHSNTPNPDRKIRIGYVSPDFRDHPIGRFMLPLIKHHDCGQFEIVCYAHESKRDAMLEQIQSAADHWRRINSLDNDQLCELIRSDQIDILVDLSQHLSGNRLPVFARKPAPIQVSYAGYPGSTGLTAIDYRFTDHYLEPEGMFDQFSSEKIHRLPSFWCDDLDQLLPAIDVPPVSKNGYTTFGSFNNFCKINEDVIQLWWHVLLQVPDSRLILLAPLSQVREEIIRQFESANINRNRIEFFNLLPRQAYLQAYNRIDITLDTFPYNGHATSFDSLMMGVPVVTLVGKTIVGRGGLSLLSNLDLKDLIAESPEQYLAIATHLAHDRDRLQFLRGDLRNKIRNSPLGNIVSFTQNIESAYRTFWRNWCAARKTSFH